MEEKQLDFKMSLFEELKRNLESCTNEMAENEDEDEDEDEEEIEIVVTRLKRLDVFADTLKVYGWAKDFLAWLLLNGESVDKRSMVYFFSELERLTEIEQREYKREQNNKYEKYLKKEKEQEKMNGISGK